MYIRKCCLSFNKMMFEDVVLLFDNFQRYLVGGEYHLEHARSSLNQFFDHKIKKFESEVTQKTHKEMKEQFDGVSVPHDYK